MSKGVLATVKSVGALPIFMVANQFDWDTERTAMLRALFSLSVAGCFIMLQLIQTKAAAANKDNPHAYKKMFVPPEPKPSLFGSSNEEPKPEDYVETTYKMHETKQLNAMRQQAMMGCIITGCIHFYFGITPPLLVQTLMLPVNILVNPMAQVYLLGAEVPERMWDEKLEGELNRSSDKKKSVEDNQTATITEATSEDEREVETDTPKSTTSGEEAAITAVWDAGKGATYEALLKCAKEGDVNYQTKDSQYTALMVACGNPASALAQDAVASLISMGADIMPTDDEGWTAAHWCAFHGNPAALDSILQSAAEREQGNLLCKKKTSDGKTILQVAQEEGENNGERGEAVIKLLESATK